MNIALLEFIEDAELLLSDPGKNLFDPENSLAISLHPSVSVYLKERGVACADTLNYLDNAAQQRIVLTTDEMAESLAGEFSFRDKFGIERGYREAFIHHVRPYLSHFFWIIELLNAIRDKHEVSRILVCRPQDEKGMYSDKAYIQNRERFLGFLAEDFCRRNGLKFSSIESGRQKTALIPALAAKLAGRISALMTGINYLFAGKNTPDKKTIVVPALSYGMGGLLKEVMKHHQDARVIMIIEGKPSLRQELFKAYNVFVNILRKIRGKGLPDDVYFIDSLRGFFRKDLSLQKAMNLAFDKIDAYIESNREKLFIYDGISVAGYLRPKISLGLRKEMLVLLHTTMVLYRLLERIDPKILMSMYSVGIYYMMGELSRVLGFRSLDISHGTHVPPNNEFEKIENYRLAASVILNTYSHVAVQTPWADKFLDYYGDKRPRIVSGPLIYSKVSPSARQRVRNRVLNLDDDTKVILHATTQKLRVGMRFHIEETLDEYISSLRDIVNAVNSLKDICLIIRPHPVCDIKDDDFIKLLPECGRMMIMRQGPFSEVLSAADILISFSSTCIEEAIQNRIPVILYDKWRRYNHFNLKETGGQEQISRSPAYYMTSAGVFERRLPQIIEMFSGNPLFDEELKGYKYPESFRNNFDNFISESLFGGRVNN